MQTLNQIDLEPRFCEDQDQIRNLFVKLIQVIRKIKLSHFTLLGIFVPKTLLDLFWDFLTQTSLEIWTHLNPIFKELYWGSYIFFQSWLIMISIILTTEHLALAKIQSLTWQLPQKKFQLNRLLLTWFRRKSLVIFFEQKF